MMMGLLAELSDTPLQERPHLVVLGAGASYAATPLGEKGNRRLPLMRDLPDALELRSLLDSEMYRKSKIDFEGFFEELAEQECVDLVTEIEKRTMDLFDSYAIADCVTIYDQLILSLRAKDTIVSFNWDPLLPYAYRRNGFLRTLPSLWFLHGNVKFGVCREDKTVGWTDDKCRRCEQPFQPVPLLYPISHKDYDSDPVIAEAWRHFENELSNAYFLTIFGYSAPITDEVARRRFIDTLKSNSMVGLLQMEIIDPNAEELLETRYAGIHDNLHVSCIGDLSTSWLLMHPRLSCEALYQATMMVSPIKPYPMIQTANLAELQSWYSEFSGYFPKFADEIAPWNRC
jgi:hypothetical protein